MSRFSLIVFDLDGTLIDSRRDIANAANALLVGCGAAPLPVDEIARMVGNGAAVLVDRAFAARRVPKPDDALDRFLAIYERHLLDFTRPYPGIPEVLAALGGRAALAVLTNKPARATREILDGLDLARYFTPALVVAGDGPLPRKPDPAGLRHLIEAAGSSAATTLLVGDSAVDWNTARAASTPICLARYGFGYEPFAGACSAEDVWCIDEPGGLLSL
jgi:phosphoglycolate phosphatase